MSEFELKLKNVAEPSPKVKSMYQAVSELIRENHSLDELTVAGITQKAGIGKGTAYEYFSSKEELIASALLFEVGGRLSELTETIDKTPDFRKKILYVFDWIYENRDYYQMILRILEGNFGANESDPKMEEQGTCEFFGEIQKILYVKILNLMEEGYRQGYISQRDDYKRFIVFSNAVVGYALSVSGFGELPDSSMGLEEIKEFLYDSIIKSLN